jgi:hypothetical protein
MVSISWGEESAGTELWRLGYPDKSAAEYKHGAALDTAHLRQPNQYRIYWGHYNYTQACLAILMIGTGASLGLSIK